MNAPITRVVTYYSIIEPFGSADFDGKGLIKKFRIILFSSESFL